MLDGDYPYSYLHPSQSWWDEIIRLNQFTVTFITKGDHKIGTQDEGETLAHLGELNWVYHEFTWIQMNTMSFSLSYNLHGNNEKILSSQGKKILVSYLYPLSSLPVSFRFRESLKYHGNLKYL